MWLNTIDNTKPTSKVQTLAAQQSSRNFLINWSGTDTGSGIQDYTIYVSQNGGAFTPFLVNTINTSAIYVGQPTTTYSFYSIARDLVGNQENSKTNAEATTTTPASTAPTVQFGVDKYTVGKSDGSAKITVIRTGDVSSPATVSYTTSNGTATDRRNYTRVSGTLSFAAGETSKTFAVLITPNGYAEGDRTVNLTLSNPIGGTTLGTPNQATLTIRDDNTADADTNPIDSTDRFVRQQYADFLNREPDPSGFIFWTNQIGSCNGEAQCIDIKRQNVSAAYFLSREFQETGFYVIRVQRAAFGKVSRDATKRISYQQFLTDGQSVGSGFIDGEAGADQVLERNKTAYTQAVVSSSDFTAKYPTTLSAAQFVDALYQTAGVTPQGTERQDAITAFGSGDLVHCNLSFLGICKK